METGPSRTPGWRGRCITTSLLAFSLLAAVPCVTSANSLPSGSYIQSPVSSVKSLLRQIDRNRVVRERYGRLFGLSPGQVRAAFARLRMRRLTRPLVCRVYYVRRGERLGYRVRRVPAGTRVFVMPNGQPALIVSCGNPLRQDLSAALVPPEMRRTARVRSLDETEPPEPPLMPDVEPPPDTVTRGIGPRTLATQWVESTDDFVEERQALPAGTPPAQDPPPPGARAVDSTALLLAWIGGTTTVTEPAGPASPPDDEDPPPSPVSPEPGLGALAGAALLASGLAARRRRATRAA